MKVFPKAALWGALRCACTLPTLHGKFIEMQFADMSKKITGDQAK
jgi:hypothetical protein